MSSYIDEVKEEKKFIGNVVIKIGTTYFGIRQPDSGLVIPSPYDRMIGSLTLNPTTIEITRVTTTISSFSFKLIDKEFLISSMVAGDAKSLVGQPVEIYLGRTGTGMDFSEYFKLPITYIKKLSHPDNSFIFSSTEQTERINREIYNYNSALSGDILAGTTIFSMRDDITSFPTSGFLKLEDEFVSYSGKDLVNNRFTGVIRGELNTVPVAHAKDTDCVLVETVTDNPLNILLKILISGGGGGVYDVLQSGLGISESLIDVEGIEALRDEIFLSTQFTLSLYDIPSALKYIEQEILLFNNLRITTALNSKLTVALLDKARFVEETDIIDEDTITKYPKWDLDGNKVTNVIVIEWDFSESSQMYQARTEFRNEDSILAHGLQPTLTLKSKGIKANLDGQAIVDDLGSRLLERLSTPTPEITLNTQIDKSLQTIGDKAYVKSTKIPSADGTLNFSSDLEIISRSINHTNGDVSFKLAFTSFTNIRSGFIAPSDLVLSKISQSKLAIAAGRRTQYLVGWKMRLWDTLLNEYTLDPVNTIKSLGEVSRQLVTETLEDLLTEDGQQILLEDGNLVEDFIEFENAWATSIIGGRHHLRFCDYDDATDSQKRYCFISDDGNNFPDGKQTYRITF